MAEAQLAICSDLFRPLPCLSANLVTLCIDTEPYSYVLPVVALTSPDPFYLNACSSQNQRSHPVGQLLGFPVIYLFPMVSWSADHDLSALRKICPELLPEAPGDTYLSAWWLRQRVQLEIEPGSSFQINGKLKTIETTNQLSSCLQDESTEAD